MQYRYAADYGATLHQQTYLAPQDRNPQNSCGGFYPG